MNKGEIKYRPILFSTEMVKAILEGRKTQTRRVAKTLLGWADYRVNGKWEPTWKIGDGWKEFCPYGQVDDKLWVREAFAYCPSDFKDTRGIIYRADNKYNNYVASFEWRPSIHMPRKLSRITLEITEVKVERVQDITLEDADAEGFSPYDSTGRYGDVLDFRQYWNKLNGKIHNRQYTLDDKSNRHWVEGQVGEYSWESNPWVWCISFKELPTNPVSASKGE